MNNGGPEKKNPSRGDPKETLPLSDVGKLVELLAESGIGEIRVKQGELEITVKARPEAAPGARTDPPSGAPAEPHAPPTRVPQVVASGDLRELQDLHAVRSPVVGTFYRAPTPGEEAYVEGGDLIDEAQTLCIVEALKLMSEIPADISGEVVEVLVENARGVEYDQPLCRVRPGGS